jgi:hypothetical protein
MLINGLLARLTGVGSVAWQKHRRYRAVWEKSGGQNSKIE